MGNSEAVAEEHYLHTTDADFQRATQKPTQSEMETSEMAGIVRAAGNPETQKPRHFWGVHSRADARTIIQLPDQDSNLE